MMIYINVLALASRMISAINYTVDPCDDFFEYACGSWKEKNPIPDDQVSNRQFHVVEKDVNSKLKSRLTHYYLN